MQQLRHRCQFEVSGRGWRPLALTLGCATLVTLCVCPACQSSRPTETANPSDVRGDLVATDSSLPEDLDYNGIPDLQDNQEVSDAGADIPVPSDASDLQDGADTLPPPWNCPNPTACAMVHWGENHSIISMWQLSYDLGVEGLEMVLESLVSVKVLWITPSQEDLVVVQYPISARFRQQGALVPRMWFTVSGEEGEAQQLVYLGTLACGQEVELGRVSYAYRSGYFWDAQWLVVQQEYPNNHSISTPFPMNCSSHPGDWWFNINDFTRDGAAPSQAVVNLIAMPAQPMAAIEAMLDDLIPPELVAEPLVCQDQNGPPTTYCHVHLVDASVGLGLIAHLLESLDLAQGLWVHPGDPSVSPEGVD